MTSSNVRRVKMRVRKAAAISVTLFAALYVFVSYWVYSNQSSLLYFPEKEMKGLAEYNLGDTKEVFLEASDGMKLQTWYKMPSKEGMPMIVYYHGNAYTLGHRAMKFKEIIDRGYGFIAISWRGFGKSEGHPSEQGLYRDARAAIGFLEELGYKTEDAIVVGESLGSGLAVKMATERKFKGVFLITPYTKIADRAKEIYWYLPVHALINDNFDNINNIANINAPLIIAHGDDDDVIPHTHSEKLMQNAKDPKKLIIYSGKGHANLDNRVIYGAMSEYFGYGNE